MKMPLMIERNWRKEWELQNFLHLIDISLVDLADKFPNAQNEIELYRMSSWFRFNFPWSAFD